MTIEQPLGEIFKLHEVGLTDDCMDYIQQYNDSWLLEDVMVH